MPPSNSNPINTNRVPALFAVSNVDGKTPVYLWADPTTHGLVVEATASIDAQSIPATGLTEAIAVQIVDGSGNQITSFGSGDTNLTQVGSANITLGQKLMGASLPVVLASDQSSIPVSATLPAGTVGAVTNQVSTPLFTRETSAAFNHNQVSITTTATQIVAANPNRQRLLLIQHGTADVFLGSSGVTAVNGLLLAGVKGNQIVIKSDEAVYGIVGAGTQTISFFEETT